MFKKFRKIFSQKPNLRISIWSAIYPYFIIIFRFWIIKFAVFEISNRDSMRVKFYLIIESSFEMPNVMFLTLDNIRIIYFWGIGRGLELGRRSIKEDLARKVDLGVVESRVHQTFFFEKLSLWESRLRSLSRSP